MKRSKRLVPIRKLAQNVEKLAAQDLGAKISLEKVESDRLEQLKRYRLEYMQMMQNKIKHGINGSLLQQYHSFLNQLNSAIKQQEIIYKNCGEKLNSSQIEWRNKRSKTKAISQVMDAMAVKERKELEKRELKQSDDISTQMFVYRQNIVGRN